jgi:predicted Zn-dependent protease
VESAPPETAPAVKVRREEGLAVRLVRRRRSWLASRDEISPSAFGDALRQVSRALPVAAYPQPPLVSGPWPEEEAGALEALLGFPTAVERAVRRRNVAFPAQITVRRHRRWLQVVGPQLVPDAESEAFFSCAASLPWGSWGTLLTELDEVAVEAVAGSLVGLFRARNAAPPAAGSPPAVLAPAAAAVLLHEAVAHALEADVLAASGRPEAALGLRLGAELLSVLDDPAAAPGASARRFDDEGTAVCRRWLLRDGVVEQPLADTLWAADSDGLVAGAGRRSSRHLPPAPRSTHLELLAGESDEAQLLATAEGGLFIPEAAGGRLDVLTGSFTLLVPTARRIRGGVAADPVGPFRLVGQVADLLAAVTGVGRQATAAGAGWCAKGGQKLPVWATTPALGLARVEVAP